MRTLFAICLVTIYGLIVRLGFGLFDDVMEVMSVSFLFLTPMFVGFLTVILIPKDKMKTYAGAFFLPWLTALVFLIVTCLLNIEGIICWVMIYPFFAVIAGIGGVIAHAIKKNAAAKKEDSFQKPNTFNVAFFIVVPCLFGLLEGDRMLHHKELIITRDVVISAPASEVWKQLTNINKIDSVETSTSPSNIFGFPRHMKTVLDSLKVGSKRMAYYDKGLYFEERITHLKPEELMVLQIKTDASKIPPTVMDEHIVIGGKYLDILQDDYKLEKISDTSCRLKLTSHFYINTPFNWYSKMWAEYLMADVLQGEINLIKKRAEKTVNNSN